MTSAKKPATESREIAFDVVRQLRNEFGSHVHSIHKANEAQTRLLIIDKILRALGWDETEFNPEEPVSGSGYLDYLLTIDRIPRVIVEAKRVSHTFKSPTNQLRRYEYRLGYMRSAFAAGFTEVLEQAERYGQQTGVPYAVITNGAEWALLQVRLSVGYTSLDDLKGVYFGNLLVDGFNFESFWNFLYKPYVAEGALEEYFGQLNCKAVDYSITPQSQFGQIEWKRAGTDRDLRDFYRFFFTDLIDPRRRLMLQRCFVSDARLDQYRGELKRALKDTVPTYIPDAIDITPAERHEILSSESGDKRGRVILVTGSVGCGKSTLVAKVLAEAQEEKDAQNVYLVIDLIDEIGQEQADITPILWKYITEAWHKKQPSSYQHTRLRKIFGRQLKELREGAYARVFEVDKAELDRKEAEALDRLSNDPETFFPACWRYYLRNSRGTVVVFDNVDRASESYQRQVYAFAHKLAHRTGATNIITMREVTFFRGQRAGFLDVRSGDIVYHLQAPNLEQIIAGRIRYIEDHIDDDDRIRAWKRSKDWTSFRAAALEYAQTLKRTFLMSDKGREILSLLAAISWHNVRYFLLILRRLHIQLDGQQSWTVSEVIAALMTSFEAGGMERILTNIFRPPYPNFLCYLIRIRILLMLIYALEPHEMSHGISYLRILNFIRLYGYQRIWADRVIEEMVRERFLECIEAPAEEDFTKQYELSTAHSFRRSPLAVIMTDSIITQPVYVSLIGNDLPFHKPEVFERYGIAREEVMAGLNNELNRESIELVTDATDLGRIVAHYLVSVFEDEQPAENLLKNSPEVTTTERMLRIIIDKLRKIAGVTKPIGTSSKLAWQPPLFATDLTNIDSELPASLSIPSNIAEIRLGRSTLAVLIFWSLVLLHTHGRRFVSGVDITRVINYYLVDDHNQKAPTNVSRALRHKLLQEQSWLVTQPGPPARYGLADNWKEYWSELFGEPFPE